MKAIPRMMLGTITTAGPLMNTDLIKWPRRMVGGSFPRNRAQLPWQAIAAKMLDSIFGFRLALLARISSILDKEKRNSFADPSAWKKRKASLRILASILVVDTSSAVGGPVDTVPAVVEAIALLNIQAAILVEEDEDLAVMVAIVAVWIAGLIIPTKA